MGADIAVGIDPALWRAGGLWRPARGLYGDQGEPRAQHARAYRRGVYRRARQQSLSPVAANPRTTYPPRESHVQRLHRAGFAGGDGRLLCGFPRARRPARHRPTDPPQNRAFGRRAGGGRLSTSSKSISLTPSLSMWALSATRSWQPPLKTASTCARWRQPHRHHTGRADPPRCHRSRLARLRDRPPKMTCMHRLPLARGADAQTDYLTHPCST